MRSLPAEGFQGKVPDWPFTKGSTRERSVWKKLWRTPQAVAWADEPWRWETIAMYVRWKVRAEAADAGPGIATAMIRLSDQIGMSPAGLAENRWAIADAVPEPKPERPSGEPSEESSGEAPVRRLRAVADD
ncbi:hypothetical protein [Tomitella gaofuii]|uniref:hypothetical protein n=1 Tax=Tomitella gaofuii TaxID=2760083 RepID=UPI001F3F21E0|nr:hypothetical protein [Tomitella gaofuii]